jgi:hypothetical protein
VACASLLTTGGAGPRAGQGNFRGATFDEEVGEEETMIGSTARRRRRREGERASSGFGEGALGRSLLLALALFGVGMGGGYLYAAKSVFATEQAGPVEFVTVPGLIGLTVDAAARQLQEAGLTLGEVDSIRHPRATAGGIVGQAPFQGQLALRDAPVDVAVSLGPEVRPLPDVTRIRGDRALTVLETSGFQVTVDSVQSQVAAGQVISTDPRPGTRLSLPAQVRMTVSLGPPLVAVPDLIGLTEDQARARLLEVGLSVGEIELESRFGFGQGDVLRTFPEADAMIPQGSPVRLVVRRRALLPGGTFP